MDGVTTNNSDDWESNEVLFARFHRPVYQFLANKLSSRGEVEDLMSETFLVLVEKRARGPVVDRHGNRYRSPGHFLLGVARYLLLNHLKKRRRGDIWELSVVDQSAGVRSLASLEERKLLIRELLRELPLGQQMALEMFHWQHVPYKEIAKILEVPEGTVAIWLRRGRETLGARWQEIVDGDPSDESLGDPPPIGENLGAYAWYDVATGAIDLLELAEAAMVGNHARRRCTCKNTPVPEWLLVLDLPTRLPRALAADLAQIVRKVWRAWVDAGRPSLPCPCATGT